MAADLPTRKAPPPMMADPVFSWTGVYVGGQVGGAWNSESFDNSVDPLNPAFAFPAFRHNQAGLAAGGHIGANYQIGQFVVLGAEGEFDYIGIRSTSSVNSPAPPASITTKQNYLGSIDGKLGFAFDRFLVSAVGGVAFTSYSISDTDGPFAVKYPTGQRTGWNVGVSVDYALTNNWIIGVNYKYYDFGSKDIFSGLPVTPAGPGLDGFKWHPTENVVTASVSYKF
jgi:outer membrane immunogenic protein